MGAVRASPLPVSIAECTGPFWGVFHGGRANLDRRLPKVQKTAGKGIY